MCYNNKYNSKVNSKGGLKMNLFNLFDVSVREKGKKLTAMVLTLFLAAGFLLAPSADMTRVYAGEDVTASEPSGEEEPGESIPLTVTRQPANVTVSAGETATFSVGASGVGLKYQWYYRKAGAGSWVVWKGHTTATTSATANATWNLMKVYCRISDEAGSVVSSRSASVSLRQPLTISAQPRNIRVRAGEKGTFSVTAQGTGRLSFQWYVRKAGAPSDTLWKGHVSATTSATANSTWNKMKVWCVVTDEAGQSVQSDAATVTILQPLTVLSHPADLTVKPGDTARFTVSAQGTGDLRYQWYYKKSGAEGWTLWNGHTTASTSAVANATWNLMQVCCRITDEEDASVESLPALVKVDQPLTVVTHPVSKTVTAGRSVDFTVTARGMGEYSYQWYRRMKGDTSWSLWNAQTSQKLTVKAEESMNGMQVYCRVSDESGARINSSSAALTVVPAIKITAQPAQVTVHSGETARFTVKAEGSGLTYQWYYKKAGKEDWTLWKDRTSATATGVADCTWHVMQVFCRITDETGETADSDAAFAMITKKSDQRYIKHSFKIKSDSTKVYSGPGTSYSVLGTVNAAAKYTALEWCCDSSDVTWFRFSWKGKDAWVSRKKTTVTDEFVTIPNRSFKNGGVPIIYLSPSRQTRNEYAAGSTTEGVQMYRVGEALKKILEEEYLCVVYMPPVEMKITLNQRPTDAYNKEADVYLAIHSNANTSGSCYGAVGYYFPACEQSKALGEHMADEMGKISPFTPTVKSKTVNGMTAFDNIGYGEVRDPSYFGMISLLAEVEYHDNADSARWIINNPNKIARALANALEKTLDMQKK